MAKTVLIVEDDELSTKLYQDILHINGYETLHVDDGSKAMNIVAKSRPDLIIMDIQLPNISGIKITEMLRSTSEFKDIPIIAVTAFPHMWSKNKCLEAGCDMFVAKPIYVPEFLETIAKFIG